VGLETSGSKNQDCNYLRIKIFMISVIEKIKNKAEELGIVDRYELENILVHDDPYWDEEYDEQFNKFTEFLDELGFKIVHQEGGGEGGGEYCEVVIELEGKTYKLNYEYRSYEGYTIDDIWNWDLVTAKQKMITVYE
jgi:hypothetical protein